MAANTTTYYQITKNGCTIDDYWNFFESLKEARASKDYVKYPQHEYGIVRVTKKDFDLNPKKHVKERT